eukprot:105509_1
MATITETIVSGTLLAIILLFIVPFLCYYLHVYYKYRLNPIIHKRHYKIMMAFDILLIISLMGDKSLYMISIILTDNIEEAHRHILYDISDYVYYFVGPTVVLTMGLCVWMLYYDTTWATITNPGNNWTHFINPQYDDNHTDLFVNNWFINNKQRFGNTGWLTKFFMIPILTIIYLSLFASELINDSVHYFVFMGWMVLTALFIAIIQWHIPKQKIEIFNIKLNIDRMIRVEVSFAIFFAIYVILRILIVSPKYQFTIIMPFQYVFALHYFIGGILPTRYVLFESQLLTSNDNNIMRTMSNMPVSMVTIIKNINGNVSESAQLDSNIISHLSLMKILKEKISWDAFMKHLISEFSSENLLCILETWQFKQMIKEINDKNKLIPTPMLEVTSKSIDSEIDSDCGISVEYQHLIINDGLVEFDIPPKDEMPLSAIVNDKQMSVESKAVKLIEKYVYKHNGHCLFEVNISSACKYKMIQKVQQLGEIMFTMQQIYDIFDEMLLELIRLLNDSHARFLQTDDYKQLILHDAV